MSAAQALAGPRAPRRPSLTLVAPAPPTRSWEAPKRFREPEAALLATFRPAVYDLLGHAEAQGRRAAWFTFTSRIKVDRSKVGRERVRQDLKRRWAKFRNSAAWRKVPGALVIFATHGRPHVHVLAVMPEKMPLRAIYGAWTGGFTDSEPASTGDAEALARYCAAQRDRSLGNTSAPHRFFTFRRPPPAHLDCRAPAPAHVVIAPVLPAAWRAGAGGGASLGEVRLGLIRRDEVAGLRRGTRDTRVTCPLKTGRI